MERFKGTEDELTDGILKVFYQVYNELGHGFLETVYARAMGVALEQAGFSVASEVMIPVSFRGILVGSYRADLIVNGKVLLEFKTADQISKAHEAQLMHYLRATPLEVGLVLSFGDTPKLRRAEFLNERKRNLSGSALIQS